MKKILIIQVALFIRFGLMGVGNAFAQFPPQANLPGSTAVKYDSSIIVAWATEALLTRGYLDIAHPYERVSAGTINNALGPADGSTISMGDSGVAVLQFAQPIINGDGPDFVVFENGFLKPNSLEEAFLELAFVEVSSDGEHYVRFPAISRTQTTTQIGGFDFMDCVSLHNLAGKYISGYGTPFDLDDLRDSALVDIDNITHVRIVDVVGAIGTHASYDSEGNVINDPYPTGFATGGFDLDAVGVIHARSATGVSGVYTNQDKNIKVFPNPVKNKLYINISNKSLYTIELHSIIGERLFSMKTNSLEHEINMETLPNGLYFLSVFNIRGEKCTYRIVK